MMIKKTGAIFALLIFVLLASGVSVWEGAAAVSLNGELPEEGYYVATRSFPRNTVVDITNLETGRTIRVIVAAALEAPGLLAVISRDTARAIGLQSRSIGRIRMTMPSDPIAFSRFGQGVNTGDPDFDPRAALAAAGISPEIAPPPRAETVPAPGTASGAEPGASAEARPIAPNPPLVDLIVDLPPPAGESPAPSAPAHYPEFSSWGWTAEPDHTDTQSPPGPAFPETGGSFAVAENAPHGAAPSPAEPETETPARSPVNAPVEPGGGQLYLPGSVAAAPEQTPDTQLTLVPAENRIPVYPFAGLPPEMEIPPITRDGITGNGAEQQTVIPEELIIPSIPERGARDTAPLPPLAPEVSPIVRENARALMRRTAPGDAAPGGAAGGEDDTPINAPDGMEGDFPQYAEEDEDAADGEYLAADTFSGPEDGAFADEEDAPGSFDRASARFSAPVITELARGQYYLQLGAWKEVRRVEEEISRLGSAWPLVIQAGGSGDRLVYRLLLGPVNLGESGALLERFRVRGYRDAFVRHN